MYFVFLVYRLFFLLYLYENYWKLNYNYNWKKKKCCLIWCIRIRFGFMVNMVIYLFELFIVVVLLFICIRYIRNKVIIYFIKVFYYLNYVYVLVMYEDCFVEYFCRF